MKAREACARQFARLLVAIVVAYPLVVAHVAGAEVDCPPALVEHLQPEGTYILIKLQGQGWHVLDDYLKPEGDRAVAIATVQAKLEVALSALERRKLLMLRYPDGYDCAETEYSTPATAARIDR